MRSWIPREDYVDRLILRGVDRALAASARRNAEQGSAPSPQQGPILTPDIARWLAQLRLLYGVPFEYLVADARMLPAESLRFFYIDRNFTDLMVDGALSLGIDSTADQIFQHSFFEDVQKEVDLAEPLVRRELRGQPLAGNVCAGGTITGLLFRSEIVSGWPGMEVQAFAQGATTPLEILRMDHLSASLLLCLFNGVPEKVEFREPPEGLHFGLVQDPASPPTFHVLARGLGLDVNGTTHPAGFQLEPAVDISVPMRTGSAQPPGVVDLTSLLGTSPSPGPMITSLQQNGVIPTSQQTLTPAELAIQMVRAAGLQTFETGVDVPPLAMGSRDDD